MEHQIYYGLLTQSINLVVALAQVVIVLNSNYIYSWNKYAWYVSVCVMLYICTRTLYFDDRVMAYYYYKCTLLYNIIMRMSVLNYILVHLFIVSRFLVPFSTMYDTLYNTILAHQHIYVHLCTWTFKRVLNTFRISKYVLHTYELLALFDCCDSMKWRA
jgi:hypothetical protein